MRELAVARARAAEGIDERAVLVGGSEHLQAGVARVDHEQPAERILEQALRVDELSGGDAGVRADVAHGRAGERVDANARIGVAVVGDEVAAGRVEGDALGIVEGGWVGHAPGGHRHLRIAPAGLEPLHPLVVVLHHVHEPTAIDHELTRVEHLAERLSGTAPLALERHAGAEDVEHRDRVAAVVAHVDVEAVVDGHAFRVVKQPGAQRGEEAIAVPGVVVDLDVACRRVGHIDASGAVGGDALRVRELPARLERGAERAVERHQPGVSGRRERERAREHGHDNGRSAACAVGSVRIHPGESEAPTRKQANGSMVAVPRRPD